MTTSTERPRVLSRTERALERAALRSLQMGDHTWGLPYAADTYWHTLRDGLIELGAIGFAVRNWTKPGAPAPTPFVILWELLPDDEVYLAIGGDGKGDLFAVSRESVLEHTLFADTTP